MSEKPSPSLFQGEMDGVSGGGVVVPLLGPLRRGGGGSSTGTGTAIGAGVVVGATWAQTLGNVVVSIIGTGMLGLPYAFRMAGWLAGSLGVVLAGLSTHYCMLLLVQCRKKIEEANEQAEIKTYGDLGFKAFGWRGRHLTELLVTVSQAGGAIAYLVFIGQNLSSILSVYHISPSAFVFLLVLPLEIALSLIRSLATLAPFSAFADACNVLAMAIVIKDDIEMFNGFSKIWTNAFRGVWGLPFAGGVAIFCFEGFSMVLPLEDSMAERGRFRWVLSWAFFGITVAYICFGIFGYFAYGEDTRDIVTLNLPNDWSAAVVKVGLCVALAFTFPIMLHPIHEIVESRLKASGWFEKLCHNSQGAEWVGLHLVRALLVVGLSIMASFVPGFGVFISFIGSTVCALLSFVLPATFHLTFMGSSLNTRERFVDYGILVLGLVFAGYGTYTAVSGVSGGS